MSFPADFVWGAATASYQIEGATREDGRGLTVWDMACRKPGAIWSGNTGDEACDHYHRYKEDVAHMQALGLGGYRFSIAWSRILPAGTGAVNEKGLDFYDRLVDELLAAGITPYTTLFHWDMPYEVFCRGGWLNRDVADWFADYTKIVVDRLSDRVQHWMTLNEPQCFVGLGMRDGIHAPLLKLDMPEILRAAHHALLAHGRAVQAIRANTKQPATIGYAPVGVTRMPLTESAADIEAARKFMFSIEKGNYWNNIWWMDPVFLGHYPEDGLEKYAKMLPPIQEGDMAIISQPLDFCGANIYAGDEIKAGPNGEVQRVEMPIGYPTTAIRWQVSPEALYWGPRFLYERYKLPIIVTENGMSNADVISLDGKVHDPQRIDYLQRYLRAFRRAGEDGVPIKGYFQWSLLDNFEWAEGYKERFGIIYTDYPTQRRIWKDSAYWYQSVVKANGENL